MATFGQKSAEEQQQLIDQLGELLIKHKIPADVKVVKEIVCNIKESEVQENVNLVVKKDCPQSMKEAIALFKSDAEEFTKGVQGIQIGLVCAVGAGSKYQTIENITTIQSDEKVNLEHDGQAWLLDFWATWCGPCQRPMAHNQEMLEKNQDAWKDKVKIIGISIDNGRQTVVSHVESKKWGSVVHYHRAGSSCSDTYNVRGVPHVMLIDKEGTIVFKGHPASRPNLEDDLNKLGNGQKLEGEGIVELIETANEEASAEIAVEEGFKEMNTANIDGEIVEFKAACEQFQKDENLKAVAKDMPRSFCVIVLESSYHPSTKKSYSQYKNYRVLVGKQESIDTLKTAFGEKLKGTFEIDEQIRAI